jgi:hypothetical protein
MSALARLYRQPRTFARALATHAVSSSTSIPPRKIWEKSEIQAVYDSPLLDLVYKAASVHRMHHDPNKIQLCTLMNIKSKVGVINHLHLPSHVCSHSRRV